MEEKLIEQQTNDTAENLQQSTPQTATDTETTPDEAPQNAAGATTDNETATEAQGDMTIADVVRMIAEAESKGYERGRRDGAEEERKNAQQRSHSSMWEDRHLTDAEDERQSWLEIDNEFLTRIRPTAWD
ncbi:MAG: hypothetical protein K2G82_03145 [Paramuribaculum sp.]|nr:hypothetical protein [Paramuribaculum sp.]